MNLGTLITGSARSGTTLALRVHCPDLTAEEERHNSDFNEPLPLTQAIRKNQMLEAERILTERLGNRHHLVKSPHACFLAPYLKPNYHLIVIFRDLRLILPSMLRHPNVLRYELRGSLSLERALTMARQSYERAFLYEGSMEVWNYGFWEEWKIRNRNTGHLYGRPHETSDRVLEDIRRTGEIFSKESFSSDIWEEFCETNAVTNQQRSEVLKSNEAIRLLYEKRGFRIKTYDDIYAKRET